MHPALLQPNLMPRRSLFVPSVLPTDVTWITQFQAGHGWMGSAPLDLNSTDAPLFGSQCVKYGPDDPDVDKALDSPSNLQLDLSGKVLVIYCRNADEYAGGWVVYLGNSTLSSYIYFAVSAYYLPVSAGISCIRLELAGPTGGSLDLSTTLVDKIRIRINNPSDTHTEYLYGVAYEDSGTRYPNGAITITYDDASASMGDLAFPLHEARSIPGVAYIIGESSENTGTSPETLRAMQTAGWEIGGHADRYADHIDMTALTAAELDSSLSRMKRWLVSRGLHGKHFAYPHGISNTLVQQVASKYFCSGRGTGGSNQPPSFNAPYSPMQAYTFNGLSFNTDTNTKTVMKTAIDKANAKRMWLTLLFHGVSEVASSGAVVSTTDLAEILDYAIGKDMAFVTLDEMFGT